jgi:hypothetical protein
MTKTIAKLIRGAAVAAVALMTFTLPGLAQYSTPMHDVDNGARQPVQFNINLFGAEGSFNINGSAYQVPAGKRLVIEQITARVAVDSPQWIEVRLGLTAGSTTLAHYLRLDPPLALNGGNSYYTTLPVRYYADPGTSVVVGLARSGGTTGSWNGSLTFSGYLVNLP